MYCSNIHTKILLETITFQELGNLYINQLSSMLKNLNDDYQKFSENSKSSTYDSSFGAIDSTSSSFLNKKRGSGDISPKHTENLQKVKLIKNNKIVYVTEEQGKTLIKKNKKQKKITFVNRGQRGSKYRGVSRNGNQWQVLIMTNKSKSYVGSYPTEDLAARIYDIVSLKNHGTKAKTNFCYSEGEIQQLITFDVKDHLIDFKIKAVLNQQ